MLDALLRVRGLRIETTLGADIVDDVNLDVLRGEVLALVGESGCGKTSTALALMGHARAGTRIAQGSVEIDGRNILTQPSRRLRRLRGTKISYVPQNPTAALNPRLRIGYQISEALVVHGMMGSEARKGTLDLLARVGLPCDVQFAARYAFELSGGQQQRVAIAMALACCPSVVVLDEPTTGLDVITQARILELLKTLGRETGTAFVYVTHDLAVVDELADRVAIMYAGRIIELGCCKAVFEQPAHPYTMLLLASVPRLSCRRRLKGIPGTAPPPGSRPGGCFFAPRCPHVIAHCHEAFPPDSAAAPDRIVRCWRVGEFPATRDAPQFCSAPNVRRPLLNIEGLTANYGQGANQTQVLADVSFEIAAQECLALVGQSGSGKSTIGRCIAGLHAPSSGEILLNGKPLARNAGERSTAERQALQIIFQNPDRSLNPAETVAEALLRPLRLFGMVGLDNQRHKVADLLEQVRLPVRFGSRYPRELSGGEKQRVAIARALAARPELLICDEITSALDVSIQAAVIALLEELRLAGLAMLFITHNLAVVNAIADRTIVLERGRICEQGETAKVISSPEDDYTRRLIAAAPDLGRGRSGT